MRGRGNSLITVESASQRYSTVNELPEQFLESLRLLFDILNTSRTGLISFQHLTSKWQQLPTRGLPPNFLESLRRVTPPNGLLDFERFIAGVQISLQDRIYDNYQTKLHRVRSEGKLHDIENDWRNLDACKFRSIGTIKDGPAMGVTMVHPTKMKSNIHNGQQIKKRKDYRSQPNISATPFFDRFSGHSKENFEDSGLYDIVMRPKKAKNIPAPLPPKASGATQARRSCSGCYASPSSANSSSLTICDVNLAMSRQNRPNSINSAFSGSSGFSEVQSAHSSAVKGLAPYADELRPQVVKHEQLLSEEWAVVHKGADTTTRLQRWFQERVDSLQKRKSMLERGMVSLDSAVHEQKLNFYRAQISELVRRMNALMGTSEHGFPTHGNMNAPENGGDPDIIARSNHRHIHRDNLPDKGQLFANATPRATTKVGGSLGSSASSSTRTSVSTPLRESASANSSPEPKFDSGGVNIDALMKQRQKLFNELDEKSRLIEKLQREKRVHEMREAEARHKKPIMETIRKPVATGKRRPFSNISRKLINDTLL